MDRRSFTEIGVAALILLICAVFWVQAYKLPPGSFEPLGSGPVPMYTAAIIILCCVIVIARALAAMLRGPGPARAFREEFASGGSPLSAVLILGGSVVYVGFLHLQVAGFGLVTFIFLAALIWAMERLKPRKLPLAILVAAIFAFGAEYLFTNVFVVDLPT